MHITATPPPPPNTQTFTLLLAAVSLCWVTTFFTIFLKSWPFSMPQQACKKAAASVVLLQSGRVIFISCCLSPLPEPELVSLSGQVLLCLNKNGSVALALHTSSLAFLFVFDNLSIWLTTSLPLWGLTFL